MKVAGSRVLITGASSGIGAAAARLLAAAGATVGLVGRRAEKLAAVLDDCRSDARTAACGCPISAISTGPRASPSRRGTRLAIWMCWSTTPPSPRFGAHRRLTMVDVEQAMRVNFFSPAPDDPRRAAANARRGGGMIVNVASMGGRLGIAHEAAYGASKFALCGWSESLAIDLHDSPIGVRLIQPGPIDTDIWDRPGEDRGALRRTEGTARGGRRGHRWPPSSATASSTTCPI